MPITIRNTTLRYRVSTHLFEIATVLVFMVVGATLLHDPSVAARSPVGRELSGWSWTWSSMYLLAGPPILWSILVGGANRWRVLGLVVFSSALCMQGTAAATKVPIDPRTVTYFLFAIACAGRAARLSVLLMPTIGDDAAPMD